jgi:hypothetical protein
LAHTRTYKGLQEVVLLVLELKKVPNTWHHKYFSVLVSANPDCMVQLGVTVCQSLTFLQDHSFKLKTDNTTVFSGLHGN